MYICNTSEYRQHNHNKSYDGVQFAAIIGVYYFIQKSVVPSRVLGLGGSNAHRKSSAFFPPRSPLNTSQTLIIKCDEKE